ncbi:hypothetical protein [Pseudonocardia sp.]|uniref:hypothetical protein n=1 Tax=Pseudonocardia sp. TaxID=60912 RepID=UPI003D131F23
MTDAAAVLSPTAARIHGWAVILGPLLLLASTLAFLTEGGVNAGALGGVIGVWSVFTLAIGFVGLHRLLEPLAPRAAPVVLAIGLIGFTAGAAFNLLAVVEAPPATAPVAFDAAVVNHGPFVLLALLPWGWFAPLTFVLTGILLLRTGLAARWSALLMVVAGLLFLVGRPARIDAVALAADVALVVAMVPLGWAMVSAARRAVVPTR